MLGHPFLKKSLKQHIKNCRGKSKLFVNSKDMVAYCICAIIVGAM
jgi:hypothetical protein